MQEEEEEGGRGEGGGATEKRGERIPSNAMLSKEVQQGESFCNKESSTHPGNPILFEFYVLLFFRYHTCVEVKSET